MLDGMLYDVLAPDLAADRDRAKELLYDYNHMRPSKMSRRRDIMHTLLGTTGERFVIEQPFYCDYGYNIHIGDNVYVNVGCTILDAAEVRIGDNVLLAPNVGIYTAGHPEDVARRSAAMEYAYPVTIGNNVWIGAGVVIVPGVTIGDNSIIGAGSVVTRSIPADVIAVGNPCRVLRPVSRIDAVDASAKL